MTLYMSRTHFLTNRLARPLLRNLGFEANPTLAEKGKDKKIKITKRKNWNRQKDEKTEMFEGSIAMIYRFLLTRYSHHIFLDALASLKTMFKIK